MTTTRKGLARMKTIIAALTLGLVVGGGTAAVAAELHTPPPAPSYMTDRPCTGPDHYYTTNCYWNEEYAGPGVPSHFRRNFRVWVEDGTPGGRYEVLRCYFYSQPTDTGKAVDHCIGRDGAVKVSGQWLAPTAETRNRSR